MSRRCVIPPRPDCRGRLHHRDDDGVPLPRCDGAFRFPRRRDILLPPVTVTVSSGFKQERRAAAARQGWLSMCVFVCDNACVRANEGRILWEFYDFV